MKLTNRRFGFRVLAWVRLCASLAVGALFVRVYTSSLAQWAALRTGLLNLQFSGAVARGGLAASITLLWLSLSALFGRWYCGVVCPLGTAQEAVRRSAAPAARNRYIAPSRLRYAVPFLAGVGLMLGLSPLFALTDPVSTFGRGVVGFFDLFTVGLTHPSMWISVIVFSAILAVAALRGRRFCDWCPVGTILGLCSRVAPFGMRLDPKLCVSCGSCEKSCPMNCLDSKNKIIDQGRCVLCLSCAGACHKGALGYGLAAVKGSNGPRRSFLQKTGRLFIYASGTLYLFGRFLRRAFFSRGETLSAEAALLEGNLNTALPPGAQDIGHLDIHCIGCKACVAACPVDLLRLSPVHPHLDYSRGYCQYNCTECGRACPAGAIHALTPEEKHTTRIALSEFLRPNCVAVIRGESCGACAEVCPTHALRMVPIEPGSSLTVPEFEPEYCIGCGGCLNVCPAEPKAFVLRGVSPQSRTPGMRRSEREEGANVFREGDEFPF